MKYKSILSLSSAVMGAICWVSGLGCAEQKAPTLQPPAPQREMPLASSTPNKAGGATKIGYIKVEKIITPDLAQASYHEWRDRVKELQVDIEGRYAKLAGVHQKIKDDEAELVRKSKLIDERARQDQERQLQKRSRDLAGDVEALNADRQQALQTLQGEIFAKVEKTARELATKPGKELDLILYAGGIYVSDSIDITEELIDLLNTEYDAQEAKKATAKPASSEPSKAPAKK